MENKNLKEDATTYIILKSNKNRKKKILKKFKIEMPKLEISLKLLIWKIFKDIF